MSVTATFWVRAQRVGKGSPKAVLIALADFANEDFRVWASMAAIEQFIEQDRKTILSNIKRLKQLGYLEDTGERKGLTGQIVVYQMTRPATATRVQMTNREGRVVEIGPPVAKPSQKRNGSENGTVPNLDGKGPVSSVKGSRISVERVPKTGHGTTKELKELSGNDQLARRVPRVALHADILSFELPETIPFQVWDMWCEHREAKAKDAPWTRPAATISIKRLLKLDAEGQSPEVTVEEAVLRGWTGLFPVRAQSAGSGDVVPDKWWTTESGITQRAAQLGIERRPNQLLEQFKAKVVKAAGAGEWMEDMLRTVSRESESRYEALYAYFNDIPKEPPLAEAA